MKLTQITDHFDADLLEAELDEVKYDRITFMRDDMGTWWAKVSVEDGASFYEAWFAVSDVADTLDEWHDAMRQAVEA